MANIPCFESWLALLALHNFILDGIEQTLLSDPGVPGVQSMGRDVSIKLFPTPFVDFTDVTLATEGKGRHLSFGNCPNYLSPEAPMAERIFLIRFLP